MAQSGRLARRYAQAIGELAHERGLLDRVEQDFGVVRDVLAADDTFRRLFYDQRILAERKEELLRSVFSDALAPESLHALLLIVRKRREAVFEQVVAAYTDYANRLRGIIEIEISSAREMDDEFSEQLRQGLEKALSASVRLRTAVDPSLLGGVRARVGDLVIDGSAAARLAQMGRALRAVQLN